MKSSILILKGLVLCTIVLFLCSCSNKRSGKPKVLVFAKTSGYPHESIPAGVAAIQQLGSQHEFEVDTTRNPETFNEDSLKQYAAVVFLSTTGDVLNHYQEAAFERYIQSGGSYVGIHAAADSEYDWGWYGRMTGGYYLSHPGINDTFPNVQEGVLNVAIADHPATKHLPKQWKSTDEFYSYKKLNKDVTVLLTIDEKSYKGGANGENHPMAWYHDYDGGRAFYTALGHTKESFADDNFLKHILGGIEYAIGDNEELDYDDAKTQLPPEEDRFSKTQLVQGTFFEPTEMTVLPNLDIMVVQRRGEILLFKNETKKVKQIGFFDVYYKTLNTPGVNAEEGILGLSKDPDFAKNNWVYIYYSPSEKEVNRLSRFTFQNDTLSKSTEKIILEVPSQREICCHTGGSIAFGPDKLLYLSSGDNSTPFNERDVPFVNNGFAPLNDLPGHEQYDARRSAGNTNDLRGKIMRIKVNDDGTYEIPDGNLFPKGTANTRPEIYVMGNRNPYRISVDQKNSYLYWGEVGPDAREDSFATRGPRGYDELNQARKAGFHGWPLFVGNNYPYREFDYASGSSGITFDPAKPINDSKNNTGLTELPPAVAPLVWYPYNVSNEFPQLGTGGRNAMAGPVYYTDMFPKETRLPDYYNGKLIFYEWMRGWIKAVTLLPNGDFDKMEPFGNLKLNSVIDMEVGPDGKLYLLEYGNGWFSKNPDAGIARIDFNAGNMAPVISKFTVDKTAGILPLVINVAVEVKDLEKDKLTYVWDLGNGTTKETTVPELSYSYTTPGDYKISVEVKDAAGSASKSEVLGVYAGNDIPVVDISFTGGNKSFYLPGFPVGYNVTVADKHDTTQVDAANLYVSVDYVDGFDRAGSALGHQQGQANIDGKNLIMSLDCKSCHKENEPSVGPAYLQVAEKYQKKNDAMSYLSQKIIKGGGGVWGEVAMPAHPVLPQADAQQMVAWILSLADKTPPQPSLPQAGSIVPPVAQAAPGRNARPGGMRPAPVLVLSASYTDKGGNNIKALTGHKSITLKGSTLFFSGTEQVQGFTAFKGPRNTMLLFPANDGWFAVDSLDLTGVGSVTMASSWQKPPSAGFAVEVRLDAADGQLLGKGNMPTPKEGEQGGSLSIPLQKVGDGQFHRLYFVYKSTLKEPIRGGFSSLRFANK